MSSNHYLKDGKIVKGRWIYNRPRGGMDKWTAQIRYTNLPKPYLHSKVFYTLEEAVTWLEEQPENNLPDGRNGNLWTVSN